MSRPTGQTLSRWWLPGILFSLSEKGSPSPAGIYFSFPPGIFIPTGQTLTAVASAPETASHRTASAPDNGTGNRQRDPPARTGNLRRLAARPLPPAYRKKQQRPSPSFYGRVNNFENFPGLPGHACRTRRSRSPGSRRSPRSRRTRRQALHRLGQTRKGRRMAGEDQGAAGGCSKAVVTATLEEVQAEAGVRSLRDRFSCIAQ